MKHYIFYLLFICCTWNLLVAQSGDTTVVQTFTFQTPNPPAWSTYSGVFDFPDGSESYQRILMVQTLKCDAATNQDNYPCGEWDYLTYTYVTDSSGVWDSTRYVIPNFLVNDNAVDEYAYTASPTFSYYQQMQQVATYSPNAVFQNFSLSSGTSSAAAVSGNAVRHQYKWTADELWQSGLSAGEIDALSFEVQQGSTLKNLQLRLANTLNNLENTFLENESFSTVYQQHSTLNSGTATLYFKEPFLWDGASDILLDISFYRDAAAPEPVLMWETTPSNQVWASNSGTYLEFDGSGKYVNLGAAAQISGNAPRTIEMWARAEAFNDAGIFQAGITGSVGQDFSLRTMTTNNLWRMQQWGAPDFNVTLANSLNNWHHYAVVYNGTQTLVYYDGNLAGQKTYNINTGAQDFWLARWDNSYLKGKIDEVRVWNTALSATAIADWKNKKIDASHPNYSDLRADFGLDEGGGVAVNSNANNLKGYLKLKPQWKKWQAAEINHLASNSNLRPLITFYRSEEAAQVQSISVTDTIQNEYDVLVLFNNPDGFKIEDDAPNHPKLPTDTLYVWKAGYSYIYDQNGNKTDSVAIAPQQSISRQDKTYYSPVVRYEIGRYITPYGINLDLGAGFSWVYDVTDYAPILRNKVRLSSGNAQELLDLKFLFIKGTPPRPVLGIKNLWSGNFLYSDISSEKKCEPVSFKVPENFEAFKVITRTTGYDFPSPSGCGEFCEKTHYLSVNAPTPQFQWQVWKECADNPLYPQGGTWIFDRGGWCPGDVVQTFEHNVSHLVNAGEINTFDYDMQAATPYQPQGNYVIETQLISYGAANFVKDVAIEDIITPSKKQIHQRKNPICGQPVIRIQNTGRDTLRSVLVEYGIKSLALTLPCYYRWEGVLPPMASADVTLPLFNWTNLNPANPVFFARVSEPDYTNDPYTANNYMESSFSLPPQYESGLVFNFKTNNEPQENSYSLKDHSGTVLYQSATPLQANKAYEETFVLNDGCYVLEFNDSDEDGLEFWYFPEDGAGYARLRKPNTTNQYYITFEPDFGKNIYHQFTVGYQLGEEYWGWECPNLTDVEDILHENDKRVSIFPNPAKERVTVDMSFAKAQHIQLRLMNNLGQVIWSEDAGDIQNRQISIPLPAGASGMYWLQIIGDHAPLSVKPIFVVQP
ncbi:MAG: T9SS type A sorting domain-containing protein [Sphingobacteriales bacterium]|nr:T9SS type A sorting domain-containing protein [Sphingobacteriales bacterium]